MFENYLSEIIEGESEKCFSSIATLINENRANLSARIRSITLDNFKSVKHGKIDLIEGVKPVPFSEEPSILGLYGQNGSGKTTVVLALDLLKTLLNEEAVPERYYSLISNDAEKATMKITIEFQERGSDAVEIVSYEFSLERAIDENKKYCKVCDEKVKVKIVGYDGHIIQKNTTIFDSHSRDALKSWRHFKGRVVGNKYHKVRTWVEELDLSEARNYAINGGSSSLFCTLGILEHADFSHARINWDAKKSVFLLPGSDYDYLFLLQSVLRERIRISAVAALNAFEESSYPFVFSDDVSHIFDDEGLATIPGEVEEELKCYVENLSIILSEIIPGLNLKYEVIETIRSEGAADFWLEVLNRKKGEDETKATKDDLPDDKRYSYEKTVRLCTEKDGIVVPISNESEGIKRLIYEMEVFARAFNDPGTIAVIDEFDAGVYEYLFGEMLQLFERFGQGQLIFTSHNLRPLEVLSRKYICFTTANRDNRYVKAKKIGEVDNLRNAYLRAIYANGGEEKLYERRKSYKIAEAFRKAGMFK